MANIGINLVETDGRATPSIQGASTSVAGFIIRSQRGVPGKTRLVTNFTEFLEYFGGHMAPTAVDRYAGAYAIKGFFDNGGAVAYVARAFTASDPASLEAKDSTDAVVLLKVSAAYRGQADPGAWGNQIKVEIKYASGFFDLIVSYKEKVVEVWEKLPDSAQCVTRVNDEFTGSKFVMLEYTPSQGKILKAKASTSLAGGAQDAPADAAALGTLCSGVLDQFDTINVQLLACPESSDTAFIASAITRCEQLGDRIFVSDTGDIGFSGAQSFMSSNRSSYGAFYWPHIRVDDPIGSTRWVPPTGHVMGVMARTERERGVWKAPAGVGAQVRGALEVRHNISDASHTLLVKDSGVNAVRSVTGQGIIVDSARTRSTSVLWQFLNVRLLFNFVKSSLKGGLRWAVYEPNDEVLWNKVTHNAVKPFLMNLWRRGAFGPGAPEEVFSVKCDMENNTPENIQQGILNVEVYFYPSRPAETFILTVGQQEGGPSASES